jgi:hypothetical protein
MVAAMGPPGGARNPVDPRFISLFNLFEIQFPSTDNLRTIYQAIVSRHLAKLPAEGLADLAEPITELTLQLYNFICQKLPPTPSRFHYVFNLRDLSRVYEVRAAAAATGGFQLSHQFDAVPACTLHQHYTLYHQLPTLTHVSALPDNRCFSRACCCQSRTSSQTSRAC